MYQICEQINQSANLKRSVTRVRNHSNVEKEVFFSIIANFKNVIENKLILKLEK